MLSDVLYKFDSTGKIRTYQIEIIDDRYRMITGTKDGKKVESKWTICTPKNIDRSNSTTPEKQAILEVGARINKKLAQNYYKTEEECIAKPEQFFQVMLALDRSKIKHFPEYPVLTDPKLDGMRLVELPDNSYSRKGKPIPTSIFITEELQPFFEEYPNIILDGEIYSHDLHSNFNELMSIARKIKPTQEELNVAEKILQYHIYDMFDTENPNMPAIERKQWLESLLPVSERIHRVPYWIVNSEDELRVLNEVHVADGYEGSIVRPMNSIYENKRSKNLIKIKSFITEEFPIIDILEGVGNRSGIAGTIVVMVNNIVVGCGVKGSWVYAKSVLDKKQELIGKLATIRYFGITPDGSLRFPICTDIDRPD